MNINRIFNNYLKCGYSNLSAISKTCQNVILLKISNSSLSKNVTIKGGVVMMANSKEQICVEKIKSLLKFGIATTRYKDIFDIYYLINIDSFDKVRFLRYLDKMIFSDSLIEENNIYDVINSLELILSNDKFKFMINMANNNWLLISIDEVINYILKFLKSFESVVI